LLSPTPLAVIFANGQVTDLTAVRSLLQPDDVLIAADGGLRYLFELGLLPSLLIGDLDSADPDEVARAAGAGVRIERHPIDKDETDLELAILRAAEEGYLRILIVGALGGRLDQTLANLALLSDPRFAHIDLHLDDGVEEAFLIRAQAAIAGSPGDRVSLLPVQGDAAGVTTQALAYPLSAETLYPYRTRGISNRMLADQAQVSLTAGLLLCIHTRLNGETD
jgi:thiamine pyrophosphokinase